MNNDLETENLVNIEASFLRGGSSLDMVATTETKRNTHEIQDLDV